MIARLLRVCLGLLAPTFAIALLWLMPSATQTPLLIYWMGQPITQLHLDPLTIATAAVIAIGTAWPRPTLLGSLRLSAGTICLLGALASTTPIVQLTFLCVTSIVLFRGLGPRWYLALALLAFGQLLPLLLSADGSVPSIVGMARIPAIGLATLIGIGIVPWPPRRASGERWELLLRPIWLIPLLHTLQAGPWPIAWVLLMLLTASVGMGGAVVGALSTLDRRHGSERLLTALLLMAFLSIAISSAAGIVAALWVILAHSLLLLWTRGATHQPRPLAPFALLFLATWWAGGAASGAGAFLVTGAIWLSGTACALASLLWQDMTTSTINSRRRAVFERLGVFIRTIGTGAIMLMMPFFTRFVALPVADQVDPGLTSFGLLDHWPWIGVAMLDAAHRRVALLPIGALAPLFAVLLAAAWLLGRLVVRTPPSEIPATPEDEGVWAGVRAHVWWIRGRPSG